MAVLITGGTKGIGLAVAKRFAKPGVTIFMAYLQRRRLADRGQRLDCGARRAAASRSEPTSALPPAPEPCCEAVAAAVDQLDLVVHCAVKVLVGPILDADPDAFAEAITLNGTSLVFLVQAARPLFRRGSSVIFLSSRGSRQIVPAMGQSEPARRSPRR